MHYLTPCHEFRQMHRPTFFQWTHLCYYGCVSELCVIAALIAASFIVWQSSCLGDSYPTFYGYLPYGVIGHIV